MAGGAGPDVARVAEIGRLLNSPAEGPDDHRLGDAYREILRSFVSLAASGDSPADSWRGVVHEAMAYLGGQPDRLHFSMADYDHRRYGPFLAVSNEGGGAAIIRAAAAATPKGQALGDQNAPHTTGVAVDGERLGGVGEVPVGPDEYSDIWFECVGRMLMTTNVGSRANLRFYRRAPVVAVAEGADALDQAKGALKAAFDPYLNALGGPRPVTVFVQFAADSARSDAERTALLRALAGYVQDGGIAAPTIQQLGLSVDIGPGQAGSDAAIAAVDLAAAAGLRHLAIDGVVRKEADEVISQPGLLNYLPPDLVAGILDRAESKSVDVTPINRVDADTVAREVWSGLNTTRAMGWDLGKYALYPLTLEQCDLVVQQVQHWFADWSAAPVFYVDQGIVTEHRLYTGADTAKGAEAWLRMVARHKVKLVLIDTVDKSRGWKLLKTGDDPKGILTLAEIDHLNTVAEGLGVRVMWAGGIDAAQAYEIGRLGVFGLYVTTAVAEPAPVTGDYYQRDPALTALKHPTLQRIVDVKTMLEAGFFASPVTSALPADLRAKVAQAGSDAKALATILPAAWRAWWAVTP